MVCWKLSSAIIYLCQMNNPQGFVWKLPSINSIIIYKVFIRLSVNVILVWWTQWHVLYHYLVICSKYTLRCIPRKIPNIHIVYACNMHSLRATDTAHPWLVSISFLPRRWFLSTQAWQLRCLPLADSGTRHVGYMREICSCWMTSTKSCWSLDCLCH